MGRALLVLNNAAKRALAHSWIERAPAGSRVEFKGPTRSLDQNALMWSRLTEIAQGVVWHGSKLTAEDWKDVFTASLKRARVVPGLDGGFVPLGMRTSDMSVEEMTALLDLIEAFAAQQGVTLSDLSSAGREGAVPNTAAPHARQKEPA